LRCESARVEMLRNSFLSNTTHSFGAKTTKTDIELDDDRLDRRRCRQPRRHLATNGPQRNRVHLRSSREVAEQHTTLQGVLRIQEPADAHKCTGDLHARQMALRRSGSTSSTMSCLHQQHGRTNRHMDGIRHSEITRRQDD